MWRLLLVYSIIAAVMLSVGKVRGEEMLKIEELIIKHEGFSTKAFEGPRGALLIGYGRNIITRGITEDEARILLRNDIACCEAELFKIFGKVFYDLDDMRRYALIAMHYTLGPDGFRGFSKMTLAVKRGEYTRAAYEIKESMWYKRVGDRGPTIYNMMYFGDDK